MLFVLFHPLVYIYIFIRTRIFLGAFFPLLRYFHPISQACHFLAKLVSVCGQKGARSDVCVRFHNGIPTSMVSRLAALCMQTENVSSPSMTGRRGGGTVNFRELSMRGHHLSLWSLFCISFLPVYVSVILSLENVGCDRRSRFESWYHVEICIHAEFLEIGKVSFEFGKVEKETHSPSFGIFRFQNIF